MLIGRDSDGRVVSWMETYYGDGEVVMVTAGRNFTTVARLDTTKGKWETKTLFGIPPVPGVFDADKR
jgi:hypothetical protein